MPRLTPLNNATFIANLGDEVQPDAAIVVSPEAGGRSQAGEDQCQCQAGVGELFVEVAYSSASKDLHSKFDLYRREGVVESVVLDVRGREVY